MRVPARPYYSVEVRIDPSRDRPQRPRAPGCGDDAAHVGGILLAYFVYLAAMAALAPSSAPGRRRAGAVAGVAAVSVPGLAWLGAAGPGAALRDWWPLALMLLGYWLPALLVTAPDETLERSLLAFDDRVVGRARIAALVERGPRVVVELLELAYLCCYPLVPAGLACLYLAGLRGRADQFWTAVLVAAFGSYGTLPWFSTRPPRTIDAPAVRSPSGVRRLNLAVLGQASIQLNTCPSGHAAASLATALAVGVHLPVAGIALGLVALGISAGSVVGRYHYVVDVLGGAALALVGFAILAARLRPVTSPGLSARALIQGIARDQSRRCLRGPGCASW